MPELPDLAVMAKNLESRIEGKTVKSLTLHVDRKNNVPEKEMQDALVGHKVNSVYREGKELRLVIGKEVLGMHLMLHGELKLVDEEVVKFPILQLGFGKQNLYLTDWQKQATPTLNPKVSDVPDALDIKEEQFLEIISKKSADIKTVLVDQKNIRGIGNAYADEILYNARIAPHSKANAIPKKIVKQLFGSMQSILQEAIKQIAKVDSDRITGENRDFMKVHLPKTARTAKGEEIIVDKKGSRKSYYVESQVFYN